MSTTDELYLENIKALKLRKAESLPAPKDNEVKLSVIYGGICGSDLRVYKGLLSYAKYPLRPGHEVLGTVVEAGTNVPYRVGTKVVTFPNTYCGTCEPCSKGKTNICKDKTSLGVTVDGVFAQELILDSKYVVPVPEGLEDERAILTEPFAVTVHALKKVNIGKDTSIAVIGCGTEGLLTVALANLLGADITVIDVNPVKLEIAKRLGNVKTVKPQDIKDEVFDVVIEAAGATKAIEQAMQIVKPGGVMVALGISGDPVDLYPIQLVRNEISILGTIIYTKEDFVDALEYLKDPLFNVKPIISKFVRYTNYQEAYKDALSGNYAKIILDFKD